MRKKFYLLVCLLSEREGTKLVCDEWSEIPDNLAELFNDESSQIPTVTKRSHNDDIGSHLFPFLFSLLSSSLPNNLLLVFAIHCTLLEPIA